MSKALYVENIIPERTINEIFQDEIVPLSVAGGDSQGGMPWSTPAPTPDFVNTRIINGGSYRSNDAGARVEMRPEWDPTIGIIAYNAAESVIFKLEIHGTNTGDITMGDYAGGQGILWDNSANIFYVSGTMVVGGVGGWTVMSGYIYSLASGTPTATPNDGMVLASGNQGIIVYENTQERVRVGYLEADVYGIKVFADDGSTVIFEASDTRKYFGSGMLGTGSEISIQDWTHDIVFSITDADTIAWGSGTITLANGDTYSIDAGNTGNMSAETYVYLAQGTSITVLQTSTTKTDANGFGKIMISICENAIGEALFRVFGSTEQNIDAGVLRAASITATEIANNAITEAAVLADAITATKIAVAGLDGTTGDVATNHIIAGMIQTNAITSVKILADAVTASKINVVGLHGTSGRIVVADVTDADVVTGGINSYATTLITAGKIVISGATNLDDWRKSGDLTMIDGGSISTGTVTATQILANTITANEILANTITASEIAAGTITATQMNVSVLSAISADIGTITAGTITGNLIRTSASGARVQISNTDDIIQIYNEAEEVVYGFERVPFFTFAEGVIVDATVTSYPSCWIADTDPDKGFLIIRDGNNSQMDAAYTTDGGDSWSAIDSDFPGVALEPTYTDRMTYTYNGTDLFVIGMVTGGGGGNSLFKVVSSDSGSNWSASSIIQSADVGLRASLGGTSATNLFVILGMTNQANVETFEFMKTTDTGSNWSTPVVIKTLSQGTHFFDWCSMSVIDDDNIWVLLMNREGATTRIVEVFSTDDGGDSWTSRGTISYNQTTNRGSICAANTEYIVIAMPRRISNGNGEVYVSTGGNISKVADLTILYENLSVFTTETNKFRIAGVTTLSDGDFVVLSSDDNGATISSTEIKGGLGLSMNRACIAGSAINEFIVVSDQGASGNIRFDNARENYVLKQGDIQSDREPINPVDGVYVYARGGEAYVKDEGGTETGYS